MRCKELKDEYKAARQELVEAIRAEYGESLDEVISQFVEKTDKCLVDLRDYHEVTANISGAEIADRNLSHILKHEIAGMESVQKIIADGADVDAISAELEKLTQSMEKCSKTGAGARYKNYFADFLSERCSGKDEVATATGRTF